MVTRFHSLKVGLKGMFIRVKSVSVAVIVILTALGGYYNQAYAKDLNDVVIQNYDDNHIGWNSGRMTIDIPTAPRDVLVIDFKAKKREKITALTVHTSRWSVNLTGVVARLPRPYPSRMSVIVREWSADKTLFFINLPFEIKTKSDGDICNALEVSVENARVVSNTILPTSLDRCVY
jgi:hypothetical protein